MSGWPAEPVGSCSVNGARLKFWPGALVLLMLSAKDRSGLAAKDSCGSSPPPPPQPARRPLTRPARRVDFIRSFMVSLLKWLNKAPLALEVAAVGLSLRTWSMNGVSTTITEVIDLLYTGRSRHHGVDFISRMSRLSLSRRERVAPSLPASKWTRRVMGWLGLSATFDSIDLEAHRNRARTATRLRHQLTLRPCASHIDLAAAAQAASHGANAGAFRRASTPARSALGKRLCSRYQRQSPGACLQRLACGASTCIRRAGQHAFRVRFLK